MVNHYYPKRIDIGSISINTNRSITAMPFMQQSWADSIREGNGDKEHPEHHHDRQLRTIPYDEQNNEPSSPKTPSTEALAKQHPPVESSKLKAMHNSIKNHIEELYRNKPCMPTDDESFYRYAISPEEVIFCGRYSNIYLSHHNEHNDYPLIGRVFEPTARIEPHKSMYLKILKHLAKRHHSIIATWDIFYDANGRVVIFQEFAIHGNLLDYLKTNNVFVPEPQLVEWSQQIYKGLDFLGEIGICHRNITPKHILLTPAEEPDKINAKLGSLRDAIIYYEPRFNRVRFQPCRSIEKRNVGNFQAPEVYGKSNEEYDPISADVWSFGATMFYAATRNYPFNYRTPSRNIGLEIQKTIDLAKTISGDCKRWFSGLLKADAVRRTSFDKIESDPWYKTF